LFFVIDVQYDVKGSGEVDHVRCSSVTLMGNFLQIVNFGLPIGFLARPQLAIDNRQSAMTKSPRARALCVPAACFHLPETQSTRACAAERPVNPPPPARNFLRT